MRRRLSALRIVINRPPCDKDFDSLILKPGSYTDARRLCKSFLARNELVASPSVRFLRASSRFGASICSCHGY